MTENIQPIFRFAPSPNGELHLGHAYSALLNLKMARQIGGKMLLRIEDIDIARCTPEHERQMLVDLEWIGFEWDEEPRRQSERFEEHHQHLSKLGRMHLLYVSDLSRGEIKRMVASYEKTGEAWPRDPDGSPRHPGREWEDITTRPNLDNPGGRQIIRLNMQEATTAATSTLHWQEMANPSGRTCDRVEADVTVWGDVVLARRDTPTSYHLACVVDDAMQSVTHIVRGRDLFQSTPIHRLLQDLLGYSAPVYHHHELILDENRQKLSKSDRSTSIRQLRESGITRNEILDKLGLPDWL